MAPGIKKSGYWGLLGYELRVLEGPEKVPVVDVLDPFLPSTPKKAQHLSSSSC